jgi:3',5'-nucleoside bisphosphate phosphatase
VNEAWRQGLDAIALSDHIEYLPHKDDVSTDAQRPYELAAGPAQAKNLLFPRAAEITRDTPPGHFNAIFLKDANQLKIEDFVEQIKQANEQGAFVFWNHHGWQGSEKGQWLDVHTTLYDKKWLHGMEVCNAGDYYPEAHKWCLEKKLTMLGNSDIHDPDLRQRSMPGDHRTMNLVFVKERTLAGLKDALQQGRTAVWFKDKLIGRKEWLDPLFDACIHIGRPHQGPKNSMVVEIRNLCDANIRMKRLGNKGPAEIILPAQCTSLVTIGSVKQAEQMELSYTAENFLIAPKTGLPVTLSFVQP